MEIKNEEEGRKTRASESQSRSRIAALVRRRAHLSSSAGAQWEGDGAPTKKRMGKNLREETREKSERERGEL